MEVKLAATAGFCMGVKRAMDKALTVAQQGSRPTYTHGPLIHNPQAIEQLAAKGIHDFEECPNAPEGVVVIRAHGVPEAVKDSLLARGMDVVDGTCPHVLASQRHIARYAAKGYAIVIAGDKDHAEVEGLKSRAGPRCIVVSTPAEAEAADLQEPACLIAQTTFNEATYGQIATVLRGRLKGIEVVHSICRATQRRQEEALRLAQEVEAMVVVGGRQSANTQRLAEISRSTGKPTFLVETAADLDVKELSHFRVVGLTAGASTPSWVTLSVLQALEDIAHPASAAERLWTRALALVTRSNAYSALAAVALTYASCQLLGLGDPSPVYLLSAFCYVFAVTTLNRLALGEGDDRLLPPRVAFYRQHARALLAISILLALGSLGSVLLLRAWLAAGLLLAAYGLGVAYSVRLVPHHWRRVILITRLKDVPGSKDLFIAVGWTFVCVFVPWLGMGQAVTPALGIATLFAFVLTFIKATVVDLGDMQEDRLLGRETLPILLGAARTRRLMAVAVVLLGVVLAVAASLGWVIALGWTLMSCPAFLLAYLLWRGRLTTPSDVAGTLAADGALLLAGILALAWHLAWTL